MNRNSMLEISGRVMHQAVRMTLNQSNDNLLMQAMNFDGMNSEGRNLVERIQSFGFSSVPLPRVAQQAMQALRGAMAGGGGGGSSAMVQALDGIEAQAGIGAGGGGMGTEGTEQGKGAAAEGIALFLGGQRNHPTVIAIDDRRHRPMGLQPGENFQYDDHGQGCLLRRDACYLMSLDDEDDQQQSGGSTPTALAGAQQQEKKKRFVSLRHVKKKKEDRTPVSPQDPQTGQLRTREQIERLEQEQQQRRSQHRHEGDTVNTEVRCSADKIEFRAGNNVVGYYDKGADTWYFKGKIVTLEGTERVETIKKTYLGLDQKGEIGPIVATVGGPAKQTYAKIGGTE